MLMDTTTVETYIRQGETLTAEFKGESSAYLSDRDIYEAVVCMANAQGGLILIGVEDDTRVTRGASKARHDYGCLQTAGGDIQQHRATRQHSRKSPLGSRAAGYSYRG